MAGGTLLISSLIFLATNLQAAKTRKPHKPSVPNAEVVQCTAVQIFLQKRGFEVRGGFRVEGEVLLGHRVWGLRVWAWFILKGLQFVLVFLQEGWFWARVFVVFVRFKR